MYLRYIRFTIYMYLGYLHIFQIHTEIQINRGSERRKETSEIGERERYRSESRE